jgi:hypothetical protein
MCEFLKNIAAWVTEQDIGAWLVPLFVAFVTYRLGLRAYHRQREYELVRRRYLDEGLDAFAADVEHALAVFWNNWNHGVNVLREYGSKGNAMRKELLDTGWLDLDMSHVRFQPSYRIHQLVDDPIFWYVQQSLFAFVIKTNFFLKDDLCGKVRHEVSGGNSKIPDSNMIDSPFRVDKGPCFSRIRRQRMRANVNGTR